MVIKIKKLISLFLLCCLFLGFYINDAVGEEGNYFIVTAYYSPLPNQNFYLTGDYEDEKRLNGQGIRGASGKPVFSGMLAAPKNYAFGTKIQLEGLGVGVVEDRGGAIVNAGKRGYNYDRIDVWMGYGDEGLRRAMYWGKRKIKGNIINSNSKVTLDYNTVPAPLWASKSLNKIPNIFNRSLGKQSSKGDILKLQNFLSDIGLYYGEVDGVYNNEIINLVYEFQVENNIVSSEYEKGAGYWGNLTRKTFLKKYLNGDFQKEPQESKEDIDSKKMIIFSISVKTKSDITTLQEILTEMGLYNGELNGNYESIRDIIWEYQINAGVIKNKYERGASHYGPKTREALKKSYLDYLELNERKIELEKVFNELEESANKEAKDRVSQLGKPVYGEVSKRVRSLQKLFSLLGYFDTKDTAIFGKKTKESIVKFQIEKEIITSESDIGAGVFGPQTSKAVEEELGKVILKEKVEEKKLDQELLLEIGVYKI